MKLSKKLFAEIVNYYSETYGGVIPKDYSFKAFAKDRLKSAQSQMKRLESLGVSKRATCLDAGCGIGAFCTLANLNGFNYYGYEIDPKAYEIAKAMLKENGLDPKRITLLPPDKKFDFVSSFEVIEHVSDLNKYFLGVRKLMKKDAKFFMEMPNYLIPYEPHFYVFMLPLIPKILKWCLGYSKFSQNKVFFDELNFVTPRYVENLLIQSNFNFENLGQKEWLLSTKDRSVYIQWLINFVSRLRLMPIVKLATKIGIYTPLVYLASPQHEE